MNPSDLVKLIEILNPSNKPGRITIITRMGAENMRVKLPHLIRAVRNAGLIVTWITDPMHGNTIKAPCGLKTRPFDSILVSHLPLQISSFFASMHFCYDKVERVSVLFERSYVCIGNVEWYLKFLSILLLCVSTCKSVRLQDFRAYVICLWFNRSRITGLLILNRSIKYLAGLGLMILFKFIFKHTLGLHFRCCY
jgi:hypothetical protein